MSPNTQTYPVFNAGQEKAYQALIAYLKNTEGKEIHLLRGAAGTGKTFLLSILAATARRMGYKIRLLAPTGRAAKIITKRAKKYASTIHRQIYSPSESASGNLNFQLKANNDPTKTLYLIDEASMIGGQLSTGYNTAARPLLADLLKFTFQDDRNRKVIFIGDPFQLPPVGSSQSIALNKAFLQQEYPVKVQAHELTEVLRQAAESPILMLATQLRQHLQNNPGNLPQNISLTTGTALFELENQQEVVEQYISYFDPDNTDRVVCLCYSNALTTHVNQAIRYQLYEAEQALVPGDRILVVRNNYTWGLPSLPLIANGEMGTVVDVFYDSYEEKYNLKWMDVVIAFELPGGDIKEITCKAILDLLTDKTAQIPYAQMRNIALAQWESYGHLPKTNRKKKFQKDPYVNALQIKYGYAVTGHKAQGGQWENTIAIFEPMYEGMELDDYIRWAYTVITRATERLFLYRFPFSEK